MRQNPESKTNVRQSSSRIFPKIIGDKDTEMKSLSEIAKKSVLSLENLVKLEEFLLGTGYMTPETARREIEWFKLILALIHTISKPRKLMR